MDTSQFDALYVLILSPITALLQTDVVEPRILQLRGLRPHVSPSPLSYPLWEELRHPFLPLENVARFVVGNWT